jgi:hypothetical protein
MCIIKHIFSDEHETWHIKIFRIEKRGSNERLLSHLFPFELY